MVGSPSLLPLVFRFRRGVRLPLQVERGVGPAMFQRLNVIDDVPGAGAITFTGCGAGVRLPKLVFCLPAARNAAMCIACDSRVSPGGVRMTR